MKHTIYEDPISHRFAIVELPATFEEGDKLVVPSTVRWFATREDAVAALPDLFNLEER